ncbi:MAG: hypothetical protein H6673_07245 [Anaerolineales bacterium]|nr:hypothetical protein [Anaerolineales bacterium]
MSDLEHLRQLALDNEEPSFDDFSSVAVRAQDVDDGKIFGMNAVERMFISVGLFLVVTVFSVMLLLVTDSIAIP